MSFQPQGNFAPRPPGTGGIPPNNNPQFRPAAPGMFFMQ